MWFLYFLSWIATLVHIAFITLSIAAGLYYLAELVEEYTVLTGKVIKLMVWITIAEHVGLILFESLPISLIGSGIVTHVGYLMILKTFPLIELTSPVFLLTVCLLIVSHYLAFQYFASVWYPFSEILTFFTLCLWIVPFAFFISLSANDNVLPTTIEPPKLSDDSDVVSNYFKKKARKYNLISFLKGAQDTILPQRVKKGF